MPPKVFNPPRPSTTSSTTKKAGRPKGSTSTKSSATKPKSTKAKERRDSSGVTKSRVSAASRISLPSLSPLSPGSEDRDEDADMPDDSPTSSVQEQEDDDDPFASQPPVHANLPASLEPNLRKQKIPDDLLMVLLHEFFPAKDGEPGVRIKKDAARAVGKYMDTFVREAIARAAFGREEAGGGGELEVEDLEKLAPQLLLDF